ncbi:MAG: ATP-binding cassette domain-containing protein [Nitrosopumilaceae archaeon]|nr:ATP-binding cassette domain-containing protein [Nitrosopumilaceae archaeon]
MVPVLKTLVIMISSKRRSHAQRHLNTFKAGINYAIVGLSGSGKSTLLKLMNGMMVPSRGTVLVEDCKPDQRDRQFQKIMSRIGYIPQSLGLVRNSTVLDNVMMGALPRMRLMQFLLKRYSEEDLEEARRVLDKVGLLGKEDRKTYMLSGGEKRRVAIARAFMQGPRILLADEIVSELDGTTSREIMNLVADMQKDTRLTAVMIHHDIRLALEFADRVAVIQEGRRVMELGVDNDTILDFQSGDSTTQEILEMYDDPKE